MAEVDERLNFKGEVLIPLRDDDVRQAVAYLKRKGVEAIAVNLLFSHLNPAHELRVEQIIKEEYPEAYVALSSRVLPTVGEVGRWSTTMFSAYVAPKITEFVKGISALLAADGFAGALAFMQSNGGVATGEVVCENPAALLVSGPAAGPALGVSLGRARGVSDLVTADMGGTSFDISIIPDGQVNVSQKKIIDGKKYALPTVDVNAVGAGGGSIASIDMSGRLQVGPASAGAVPGPACYGLGGTEPTVTDANLVLGYLNPDYFLGGDRPLRKELAEAAIKAKVADPLGLTRARGRRRHPRRGERQDGRRHRRHVQPARLRSAGLHPHRRRRRRSGARRPAHAGDRHEALHLPADGAGLLRLRHDVRRPQAQLHPAVRRAGGGRRSRPHQRAVRGDGSRRPPHAGARRRGAGGHQHRAVHGHPLLRAGAGAERRRAGRPGDRRDPGRDGRPLPRQAPPGHRLLGARLSRR